MTGHWGESDWWCKETNRVGLQLLDGEVGTEEVALEVASEMKEDVVRVAAGVGSEQERCFAVVAVSVEDSDA